MTDSCPPRVVVVLPALIRDVNAPSVSRSCSRALAHLFFEISGGTAKSQVAHFGKQGPLLEIGMHMEFGLRCLRRTFKHSLPTELSQHTPTNTSTSAMTYDYDYEQGGGGGNGTP